MTMWRRDTLRSRFLRSLFPEKIPCFAARLYDRIALGAIRTYYSEVAELITAYIHQGLVLDVGTGPGYLPIEIAKRAPQIKVVGVDSSRALVRIAQKNVDKERLSGRVRFVKCDGTRLKFANDSYDFVISTGSFHAWKNPVLVIDECFRVLKRGAEVWLLDPAQIMTTETQQLLGGGLKGVDILAHWWGSFTSRLTPPYTVREVDEIIVRTKFGEATVVEGKWLTVKLTKHTNLEPQARRQIPL
jgi:SAM-dependent methyltransferase